MDPGHDEHDLDLLELLPLVLLDGYVLPEVDVVRVGDGDQVDGFLEHRLAQGLFEHVVMLSR